MDRRFLRAGAVLGFLAVAAGAFGAHLLQGRLAPDRLQTYELATRYQIYHALALLGAAVAAARWPGAATTAAGWLFVLGTLVFCGTLYGLSFGAPRWLGAVTPLGGLALLAGWAALAAAAWKA